MSRLRSYAPMKKVSQKILAEGSAFKAVYAAVDQRSEGRCEVTTRDIFPEMRLGPVVAIPVLRCSRRGVDHHHLYKPRRAHHTADQVIHVCRPCHDRMDYPFKRGRLCYVGRMGTAFLFAIRKTSDKPFRDADALRGTGSGNNGQRPTVGGGA